MFSPARGRLGSGRGKAAGPALTNPAPPVTSPARTPQLGNATALRSGLSSSSPWSSSVSVPPRTPSGLRGGDKDAAAGTQPVFVCDFPQQLRTSHIDLPLQKSEPGLYGGMTSKSGLSWVIHGDKLYLWNHLNVRGTQGCAVLALPRDSSDRKVDENWVVYVLRRHADDLTDSVVRAGTSASVLVCSKCTFALVYWPDAFADADSFVSLGPEEKLSGLAAPDPSADEGKLNARRTPPNSTGKAGIAVVDEVASVVMWHLGGAGSSVCVAIVGKSSGDLWRVDCSLDGITRRKVSRDVSVRQDTRLGTSNFSRFRRLVWRLLPREGGMGELLVLTAASLQCWTVELKAGGGLSMLWSFDLLGDKDTSDDLANQKQVWLLDLQVDDSGNTFTILVASLLKDKMSSSTFIQYSLLTFSESSPTRRGDLKRIGPLQIILPRARVEDEEFLLSMRLRIGGRPAGSTAILSGDGKATFTCLQNGVLQLYQFDLAWGAGKVLDASVIPAMEGGEGGSWLVLTETAGVWAVPERAILAGGSQPLERCLFPVPSTSDGPSKAERPPLSGLDLSRTALITNTGIPLENRIVAAAAPGISSRRQSHDEEGEALVGRFFQHFLTSGRADSALEKLGRAGAFEGEGEVNIFTRASRAIVDTLAKHWVAGGSGSATIMAAVSSQLLEKQRRHQQYLNFLSISKCHEELQQSQRLALQGIMEHGEKLAAMVQLRELHNVWANARTHDEVVEVDQQLVSGDVGDALWDAVQFVGEKARRNNVMLMDREKSEVFYTRVSDLEDFFVCIQSHASSIIGRKHPLRVQIERLSKIAEASTSLVRAAIQYRDSQESWYPTHEGITPWYCKSVIRSGLWKVASMVLDLKAEAGVSVPSMEPMLLSWLAEVGEVLLEGYAGAIAAKVEREEEYRGLQMEYWSRRDTILAALQQHAKAVVDASVEDLRANEAEQQRLLTLRELYAPLTALARRHAGYQTLFNICNDLNDTDQLWSLMRESMGLREGRFSHYVFDQLYRRKQYSKLLRFAEGFEEELATFLEDHLHLRWLHELFRHQYLSACSTVQAVALSPNSQIDGSAIFTSAPGNGFINKSKLRERIRLLYLAKLAALAGGDVGSGEKVTQINANISLIEVQEEAARKGVCGDELLPHVQLVEVCLTADDRDLVLNAFEVFAFAGESFRRNNKSLLEAAWLRAADLDNWAQIKQISEVEGWSDEHNWQFLQSTALFQASKRCYAEESPCYGEPIQEMLPLLERDVGLMDSRGRLARLDTGKKSVEGILNDHPDFSDASEAMLTALRMGAISVNEYEGNEIEDMIN